MISITLKLENYTTTIDLIVVSLLMLTYNETFEKRLLPVKANIQNKFTTSDHQERLNVLWLAENLFGALS